MIVEITGASEMELKLCGTVRHTCAHTAPSAGTLLTFVPPKGSPENSDYFIKETSREI